MGPCGSAPAWCPLVRCCWPAPEVSLEGVGGVPGLRLCWPFPVGWLDTQCSRGLRAVDVAPLPLLQLTGVPCLLCLGAVVSGARWSAGLLGQWTGWLTAAEVRSQVPQARVPDPEVARALPPEPQGRACSSAPVAPGGPACGSTIQCLLALAWSTLGPALAWCGPLREKASAGLGPPSLARPRRNLSPANSLFLAGHRDARLEFCDREAQAGGSQARGQSGQRTE